MLTLEMRMVLSELRDDSESEEEELEEIEDDEMLFGLLSSESKDD